MEATRGEPLRADARRNLNRSRHSATPAAAATTDNPTIAVLIHDNVTMTDVAGPADVFHHATSYGAKYEIRLVTVAGSGAVASNGLRLTAHLTASEVVEPFDTVIIPGAYGMVTKPFDPELVAAVRRLTTGARRIASVCTGSFLLAEVGLLDGRQATTHWRHMTRFRAAYPKVRVQEDVLFVRDGAVTTSAGIGSGVDLALALLEDDHGPEVVRSVMQQMLLFLQRPGNLAQVSAAARAVVAADRPLRRLVDRIAADPTGDYTQAEMARLAGVSPRQLTRLFRNELDTTPARYVEQLRLESAQILLQQGHPVGTAARRSGFGSTETMRRAFRARLGVSPSVYVRAPGETPVMPS